MTDGYGKSFLALEMAKSLGYVTKKEEKPIKVYVVLERIYCGFYQEISGIFDEIGKARKYIRTQEYFSHFDDEDCNLAHSTYGENDFYFEIKIWVVQ
jgi:hypothetical protein